MSTLNRRPPPEKSRRPARRYLSQNEDVRSIQAGVVLTLILWPLMLWIFSQGLGHLGNDSRGIPPPRRASPSFDIELTPEQLNVPQAPPALPKFVETNPDAPENIPDKTDNVGAQNQQAAQEKPNPDSKGDRAATEGKKDFESNQVVSGQLIPPEEAPPPAPPPTPEVAQALEQAAAARKEENPLPGFEKREGASPDGYGMNIAPNKENVSAVPEKIEGVKDAPTVVGNAAPAQPAIDPRKPQPRVQIEQQRVRPAIFAENPVGTANIGITGIDARWSNYGAYRQRLIDAVQVQWERLNTESRIYPPTGTIVVVKFRLEATEGNISEIIDVQSSGGEQAALICKSAITSRAPYGTWTDDMVAVLGQSQEMTFTFYYGM